MIPTSAYRRDEGDERVDEMTRHRQTILAATQEIESLRNKRETIVEGYEKGRKAGKRIGETAEAAAARTKQDEAVCQRQLAALEYKVEVQLSPERTARQKAARAGKR
jgi:hypothetical protein